jgi:hypothetical protein
MSHIDKVITDAQLRDIRVVDFDTQLDGVGIDIDNHRKLLKRYGLTDDKTLAALLLKEEQLRNIMREWLDQTGLKHYGDYRIAILIEELNE